MTNEWQPIETAPKGVNILLYGRCEWEEYGSSDDKPKTVVGYWSEYEGVWFTLTENPYQDICHATHWMFLPNSPT